MKFETKVIRKIATFYYDLLIANNQPKGSKTIKTAIAMALDAHGITIAAINATQEEVKQKDYS